MGLVGFIYIIQNTISKCLRSVLPVSKRVDKDSANYILNNREIIFRFTKIIYYLLQRLILFLCEYK